MESVDTETTVGRKWVEDAETAITQEQEDMRNAEKAGLTTTKPDTTLEEMLNAMGGSLCNLASSDNREDGEDKDDDEGNGEMGWLSEDDEPGWVLETISKVVQHWMERFQQNQMKHAELTQRGQADTAENFGEREMKSGTTWLIVPAAIQLETEDDAASSARITFGDPMETLDIVPG